MIVVGGLKTRQEQQDVLRQIEALGLPAITDVTSGLRFLKHPLLDHGRDFSHPRPEKILRLGGRLVSKGLSQWLDGACPPKLKERRLGEGREIAEIISRTDWRKYALFLGNSMPIRDMDTYAIPGEYIPLVSANRGASGIDGIISTACGFAYGLKQPLVAVIGDMTFLHDVSGLSFLNKISTQIVLVVVNNRGNGIFKALPIANEEIELFERYFLTPHEHHLAGACQIYGVPHQVAHGPEAFKIAYQAALESGAHLAIEAVI